MAETTNAMMAPTDSSLGLLQEHAVKLLLLGFPKCGTTAFADWLSACPQIDVSNPKETFQFCPEFAGNLERADAVGLHDAFVGADDALRMEATTLNVYSPSVLQAATGAPDLRCIILVRDPAEVAISWHNQMKHAGIHHDDDFLTSWNAGLQNQAATGSEMLQRYDAICSHGYWTNQWIDTVGHDRCLVFHASELKENPEAVQQMLEKFLSRDLSLPAQIPVRNAYSKPRNKKLYVFLRTSVAKQVWGVMERSLPALGGARRFVRDKFLLKPIKKQLDEDVVRTIRTHLADDQELLSEIVATNRQHWPL